MLRHQILTGAVNPGNHCFSVGSIASFTFWAYGSGCDLVILGVDLQPIHIIPGHVKGYKLITCLDCCQFCGKIAVSYGHTVVVYHPKLLQNEKDGVPVFTWIEETTLTLEESVGPASVLSWASSGERLLLGCKEILLWEVKKDLPSKEPPKATLKVQFSIEEIEEDDEDAENEVTEDNLPTEIIWELAWRSGIEENPHDVQFSPDDTLFASITKGDSMIKVWHQRCTLPMKFFKDDNSVNKSTSHDNLLNTMSGTSRFNMKPESNRRPPTPLSTKLDFTFTYLIHPKPVAGFSWRKGVPLLPNGTVPNVLISSCHDNMCRIWCETLTPDSDITKLAATHATTMPKHSNGRKRHLQQSEKSSTSAQVIKSISAPVINHDEAGSEFRLPEKSALRLFRHFHIAATINPTSDIPLLPSISSMDACLEGGVDEDDSRGALVFTVHWLDNKHHHAMAHLNKILHEAMTESKVEQRKDSFEEGADGTTSIYSQGSGSTVPSLKSPGPSSPLKRPSGFATKLPVWDTSRPEAVGAYLSCLASPVSPEIQSDLDLSLPGNVYELLRRAWLDQSDALFAIHPTDGSLLVWHVSYLDENRCGQIRQAQVSFSSRIPMAIPARDASTLCPRLVLYANHYSDHFSINNTTGTSLPKNQDLSTEPTDQDFLTSNGHLTPSINLLSKHTDGSLNQWEITFTANAGYSTISSINHRSRFCGHRYHLSDIFCHPTLPLLLTTSRHHQGQVHSKTNLPRSKVNSELILWRVDPVGALCHTGGVTELARLNGQSADDFNKVAWFPVLFPSWCLGAANTSPSSCFLSLHGSSLRIYQAVIDAEEILDGLETPLRNCPKQEKIGRIASQQSSSQPGCVLLLDTLLLDEELNLSEGEVLLLTIFPEDQFTESKVEEKETTLKQPPQFTPKRGHSISETFYVFMIQKTYAGLKVVAKTWKILFTASLTSVTGTRSRRNATVTDSSESSQDDSDLDSATEDISESHTQRLSYLNVTSVMMSTQNLDHPHGENISIACAACDPFSISMFHHVRPLPFTLLMTSESGCVYFWRGSKTVDGNNEMVSWVNLTTEGSKEGLGQPRIEIGGTPLILKMAHCCMLACLSAVNGVCSVSVYECLSTGGSLWQLQDRIEVGNISSVTFDRVHLDWLSREDGTFLLTVNVGRKIKIYTLSPIGMRWEDVSRSSEKIENKKEKSTPSIRPLLKRQSTLDAITRQKLLGPFQGFDAKSENLSNHLLHWSLLSEIAIGNSSGFSATHSAPLVPAKPQPVMVSWVRDGLLLVATETEMHIFCHWMEQMSCDESTPSKNGILYGSASLSHSTPEGLCQYLMQEPDIPGPSISSGTPVVSLMSVADVLSPCLPQYHPLVLSELTNGGHLGTVKQILINLSVAINAHFEPRDGTIQVEPLKLKKFILAGESDEKNIESKEHLAPVLLCDLLDENGRINDYSPVSSAPDKSRAVPVPTKSRAQDAKKKTEYDDLFATSTTDDDEDGLELVLDNDTRPASNEVIDLSQFDPGYLGPEHCQVLHNYLSRNLLPGLSSLDQMELMAIADTVANTVDTRRTSDVQAASGMGVHGGGRGYASSGNTATESMDHCGLRFVFAMHNHLCLLRSLPAPQRAKLLRQGLGSCHFAWAFHSDAEEEMLSLISSVQRGAPEWEELRSFGVGWWIRSTATLRRLIEKTARAAFQKQNSPLDAAIFYMALNKKNVLKGLFKSVHEERMMQFFSQDFSEDRWHRAALKNAFALMGKQRFQEAAAFFLLANSVQDAVEVCIEKMHDLQLAFVIVRLYDHEKSTSAHSEFLQKHVLGNSPDPAKSPKTLPDPFIRSMAHWQMGSYDEALKTLLDNGQTREKDSHDSPINITDIFNFYNFLRTHPLIVRQKKIDQSQAVTTTDQHVDDSITLEERMLFFATASSHLDAGCPLLTLDVLSSLPPLRDENKEDEKRDSPGDRASDLFSSATTAEKTGTKNRSFAANDWNDLPETSYDENIKEEFELEWSESDEEESEDEGKDDRPRIQLTAPTPHKKETDVKSAPEKAEPKKPKSLYSDVYAHQLRLMACLKVFVSELKSLATAYHSDGGQIRDQLYSWLEKETEVLHRISPSSFDILGLSEDVVAHQGIEADKSPKSEFSSGSESDGGRKVYLRKTEGDSPASENLNPAPSLHELYLAEKQDWKLRREVACHRRRWLRQYRRFLRTLLSYCGLHDDAHGALSPLRMELLLLLQDSLQERTPQQLSSPVPNPTTIPLLSSSVVACRTVVAEPTARLAHMAQDLLATVLSLSDPPPYHYNPGPHSPTIVLCRQAEALSSCIYQSLCDTNSKTYRARLLDKPATPDTLQLPPGSLVSVGSVENQYVPPSTQPSQWPGVVSLQALLNSESSDNRPKLIVLLCEALVAVHISLLVHGLQTCNSSLLYRLVSNSLCTKTWNAVFGGGARIVVKYSRPASEISKPLAPAKPKIGSPSRGMEGDKMREKLNRKVLTNFERKGSFHSSHSADTSSYREKFVAPETTLWDFFLSKPLITFSGAEEVDFESDSDHETDGSDKNAFSDDEDEMEDDLDEKSEVKVTEHGDPNSYSWHILRLAVVRSILHNIKSFLPTTGLEISELGILSPMLNSVLQLLAQWQLFLAKQLEAFSEPPPEYMKSIQGIATSLHGRPAILKHQAMLDPANTPFSGSSIEALGARRLWHCLVRRENLQELFIRFIFQKKTPNDKIANPKKLGTRRATIAVMSPDAGTSNQQFRFEDQRSKTGAADGRLGKVKILHKENEIVSSFCINNANSNCVVLATSRDVQEIDVSTLLACDSWSWIEEDMSPNLLQEDLQKPSSQKEEDFLVVSRKQSMFVTPSSSPRASLSVASSNLAGSVQTGQGTTVLLKRTFSGVRRMASHPTLPYYLTGHHDGSIRMWEWGHQQQISLFRPTGQFPKVMNLHFSSLGNKIAAVDADGFLALWQVSSPRKPFLYHQCHDRSANDCCFMSSTSVIATAGLSSTNRNVAIWDTLLPPRSMLVKEFAVHEGVGATCIGYAAQSRTLVVGGRDGKASIFDLRRSDDPLHCFAAHEAPIKCIALSSDDKIFVTGSVAGDVRVWDVNSHLLAYNLSGEHSRTSIFRNFGSGTMKVEVASPGNKIFSCGADGTLKLRILPHDRQEDFGLGKSIGSRIHKQTLQKQVVKLANAVRQQCLAY